MCIILGIILESLKFELFNKLKLQKWYFKEK